MRRIHVIPASNFERNLDAIALYHTELSEPCCFQNLLDRLFDTVITNLELFPDMGRDFLARQAASVEGCRLYRDVSQLAGNSVVREYVFDDYLLLYSVSGENLYLLAIKHHKQLSFDLNRHW